MSTKPSKQAQTAVTDAEKKGGVCADGGDPEACLQLKLKRDQAQADRDKALTGLNNAVALAKDLSSSTIASGGGSANQQGDGLAQSDISATNLAAVASAVVSIHGSSTINEALMFCIGYLSDPDKNALGGVAKFSPENENLVVKSCLKMLEEQQLSDRLQQGVLFRGLVLEPRGGSNETILATYLRPDLPAAELNRRMTVAKQAASNLNVRGGDLFSILISGPEDLRGALILELKKIETDKAGKQDLN